MRQKLHYFVDLKYRDGVIKMLVVGTSSLEAEQEAVALFKESFGTRRKCKVLKSYVAKGTNKNT